MLSRGKVVLSVVCLAGLASLAVGMAWYLSPLFITHPEQDVCSFGEVSNAEYLGFLQIAKRHADSNQEDLHNAIKTVNNDRAEKIFKSRFERISSKLTTVQGKIAAAHAVLRAVGSQYREAAPDNVAPFSFLDQKYESQSGTGVHPSRVIYSYISNIMEFGEIRPFSRIIKISFTILVSQDESGRFRNIDGYYFSVFIPSALSSFVVPNVSETSSPCPPVPHAE